MLKIHWFDLLWKSLCGFVVVVRLSHQIHYTQYIYHVHVFLFFFFIGVAGLSAVYSKICTHLQPALRPRDWPNAQPHSHWGLHCIFLRAQLSLWVSLARCQRCGHVVQQVEPQTPPICYRRRRLSSQSRRLQSGCDDLSHFIEDTGGPSVPV